MFEKIIVAVDGSGPSNDALKTASEIAKKFGSKIHIVHSPQVETVGLAMGAAGIEIKPTQEQIEAAGKEVMQEAQEALQSYGYDQANSIVGTTDPAHDILRHAEASGADLIVMGRRGLGGLTGALMGSVSQKVSHSAQCACLTVR